MVVPVGLALSGPVVVLVAVVFCCPWPGLVLVLAVSLLLVGAWCQSVWVGRSCIALGGGLVVGPRGLSPIVSAREPSPLLFVGTLWRVTVVHFAQRCRWWCGWTCWSRVCGGGGWLGLTGASWGVVWGCPSRIDAQNQRSWGENRSP